MVPSPYSDGVQEAAASQFTAVRRMRSFDEVVAQIQAAILSGHYSVGDRLPPERELCALFDVSRPTLREALRALEVLGSLDIRPGRRGGIFVASPNGDAVGVALAVLISLHGATAAELNEFRVSFEGETAAWAATRAREDEIEALIALASQAKAASQRRETEWSVLVAVDLAFHDAVAVASHNRVRVAMMLGLLRAVQRVEFTITSLVDEPLMRSVGDELRAIAEAIRAHDAEQARTEMRRHVEHFGAIYVDVHDSAPVAVSTLRATSA
jgi:GntR family transcriptional repressor for pyruvate dehydrogenase complex